MINFSQKREKKEQSKKDQFLKLKKKVTKLYPDAFTKVDIFGKYYVVDENGFRLISDEYKVKNSNTVFGAWKNTLEFLSVNKILQVNNKRFSPHKMTDNMMNKILNQK